MQDEEAYRHGYGVGQTGSKDISRQLWISGKRFTLSTCSQVDAITEIDMLDARVSPARLLKLSLMFLSEAVEIADDETRIRTIVHKQAGSADPALQIV